MPTSPETSTTPGPRRRPASASSASRSRAEPSSDPGRGGAERVVEHGGRVRRALGPGPALCRRVVDASPAGGDPLLDGSQLVARARPRPSRPGVAVVLEGAQRLGLPAGARERPHEQPARPVAAGVVEDVGFELLDGASGIAAGQPDLGQVLDRARPDLVEAAGIADGPGLVAELLQRRAGPPPQGPGQQVGIASAALELGAGEAASTSASRR